MDPAKLPRFKMVVAVDGSDDADAVVEFGLDQASRHERPELHLIRVVDGATDERLKEAHQALASLVSTGLETFAPESRDAGWRMRLHVRGGRAAEEIVNLAFEVDSELVVIGGRTVGRRRPHLGDVAEEVLATAPCPVLVVRIPEQQEHELAIRQCPACVAVRAESDGEIWFCESHTGGHLGTSTLLLAHSESLLRGGPMW